ncbi:MAG TPA: hypothetical protein DDY49_05225 [Paenibacillaceae bacterium]|nr:hypothetical protein [Paenibacillaceae bacterium]
MSLIIKENGEKRTFFQWINFLIPYVYAIGIIVILLWMVVSSIIISIQNIRVNPGALILQPLKSEAKFTNIDKNPGVNQNPNKETWLDILVKPIVESNFNKIIFRGLFLLVIWMLLFLVIPVAFKNLKRFKFFNMEFEVDHVEKAAIETVEISGTKAQLMSYLTGDDATGRTLLFLKDSSIDYNEVVEYFLAEIKEGYKKHPLNASFSYELYTHAPEELKDLVEESKETEETAVCNKNNLYQKNYLVFYSIYNKVEYITVISSYTYPFDIIDRYLFKLLHNTVSKNIENIEYMVALTCPSGDENTT